MGASLSQMVRLLLPVPYSMACMHWFPFELEWKATVICRSFVSLGALSYRVSLQWP